VEKNLRVPCMCAVLVGNDGGSISYINNQKRVCEEIGVAHKTVILDSDISEEALIKVIEDLNNESSVDGIILQLPLPKHIDETKITSKISYLKDIDGLTFENTGRLYKGERCFIPCTPQSVVQLIKSTGVSIEGKSAVVIGRSTIVGRPAAELLLRENATVTLCHSKTKNLKEICSNADILVCALGKPGFVTKDFVKENAIVIDVGTSMVEGKLKGDVLFDEAFEKAAYITPVPGGVGALTTTILIKNTCEALERNVY
jgi:methylenetetrahydrofolate dehydrogenase (NADP+)/methenyltetrahydrofolate cyclohydrolase